MLILVLPLKCNVSCFFLSQSPWPPNPWTVTKEKAWFQVFPSAACCVLVDSPDFFIPWQGNSSFPTHTFSSWLLGSSFVWSWWVMGMWGLGDQNEKGNLCCHIILWSVVMPDIKLQCWNWIGIPFWMSLLIHMPGFCQGACAVYGGAGWKFSSSPAACIWLFDFM